MYTWRRFGATRTSRANSLGDEPSRDTFRLRRPKSNSSTPPKSSQRISTSSASRSWPVILGFNPALYETNSTTQCERTVSLLSETNPTNATQFAKPTFGSQSAHIQAPPRCRLPSSMRITALLVHIFLAFLLITTTAALPLSAPQSHMQHVKRQAIPDSSGNTGNRPAPSRSQPPPVHPSALDSTPLPTVSAITVSASVSGPTSLASRPTSANAPTPTSIASGPTTAPPPSSTRTTSPNDSNNGSLGENSGPIPPGPTAFITAPRTGLSPGSIAGIVSGGVIALIVAILIVLCVARRLRKPDIEEIPIRRSRIGTNLARRVLGSLSAATSRAGSRADSRASSRSSDAGDLHEKGGKLNKADIGRPQAATVDNGFLAPPRPAFLQDGRRGIDEEVNRPGRGPIRGPFPARPASAEPLGRLSGMGLGMGYYGK